MKRHERGIAAALALLPLVTFALAPSEAAPAIAAASTSSYRSVLADYVRPEAPQSPPDKEWLTANRALRESGDAGMSDMQMDTKPTEAMPTGDKSMMEPPMSGMQMHGMEAPKPATSAPTRPHANHQMNHNGH